jgi:hypothetical protein
MAIVALAGVATLLSCSGASAATVTCPVATSAAASSGPVQWAFSEYGAPTASSWTLGKGTWDDGSATGSVHRDSIVLHFAAACASHDHTFTGSIVHVLIARNGAQVNTARRAG